VPRLGGAIQRYALAHIGDSAVLKIAHRDHAAQNRCTENSRNELHRLLGLRVATSAAYIIRK
jgi:hypothetical protein